MKRISKRKLLIDFIIMILSICAAVFLIKTEIAHNFVISLGDLQWLGIIFAGIFFTSIFTTAPSIALLGGFAQTESLLVVSVLGGFGAVLGDFIIFTLVREKMSKGFSHLLSVPQRRRFSVIFKKEIFRFFLPLFGAVIIASPLPDELGVALLRISKMSKKRFLILSFVLNSVGIFIIGWLARVIVV